MRIARDLPALSALAEATSSDISYLSSDAYLREFEQSARPPSLSISRVVKCGSSATKVTPTLVVENADLALSRVLDMFAPPIPRPARAASARRLASQQTPSSPTTPPSEHLPGRRAAARAIGSRSIIHAGGFIGDDVVIGQDCRDLPQRRHSRSRITIGSRVIIHAGSVVGSDGFGYRWDGSRHVKIPQIGTVVVEDDVEIGSCVCVDRAQDGRNPHRPRDEDRQSRADRAQLRDRPALHHRRSGRPGRIGAVLGRRACLGGQTAVRDHISMGDASIAAACSGIAEDVGPGMVVSGTPALPHRQSLREQKALRRLPDLVAQVRKLREELEQLKRERSQ